MRTFFVLSVLASGIFTADAAAQNISQCTDLAGSISNIVQEDDNWEYKQFIHDIMCNSSERRETDVSGVVIGPFGYKNTSLGEYKSEFCQDFTKEEQERRIRSLYRKYLTPEAEKIVSNCLNSFADPLFECTIKSEDNRKEHAVLSIVLNGPQRVAVDNIIISGEDRIQIELEGDFYNIQEALMNNDFEYTGASGRDFKIRRPVDTHRSTILSIQGQPEGFVSGHLVHCRAAWPPPPLSDNCLVANDNGNCVQCGTRVDLEGSGHTNWDAPFYCPNMPRCAQYKVSFRGEAMTTGQNGVTQVTIYGGENTSEERKHFPGSDDRATLSVLNTSDEEGRASGRLLMNNCTEGRCRLSGWLKIEAVTGAPSGVCSQ